MKKRESLESNKNASSKLGKRQRLCMMVRQERRKQLELLKQLKEGAGRTVKFLR